LKGAKTAKIVNEVKPEIIGGLILQLDDKTIDMSISSKINSLVQKGQLL